MQDSKPLGEQGSARRKLLRGTFAVPAVLTLHSGASMAAASINSCLVRQSRHTAPVVSYADDLWFRYQLWGYVKRGRLHEESGLWIRGSDLAVYEGRRNSVWLGRGEYQKFDPASNSLGPKLGYGDRPKGPSDCEWKRVNRWVSLRVDKEGNLKGAGNSGYDSSAVSDSCWNSFVIGHRI